MYKNVYKYTIDVYCLKISNSFVRAIETLEKQVVG